MRSISIQEAIDEYRTYNRAQNYSPSYVASADRNLRKFALWLAAEGRSQDLSGLTIEAGRAFIVYLQQRENMVRPGSRLSPDTVQQYARNLKSWATFLHGDGLGATDDKRSTRKLSTLVNSLSQHVFLSAPVLYTGRDVVRHHENGAPTAPTRRGDLAGRRRGSACL
jgi:site-specific recombinase XerD